MMRFEPREVNGKWYPVPCPEVVPLTLIFSTAEECSAFIYGYSILNETRDGRIAKESDKSREEGYAEGYEEGKRDATRKAEEAAAQGQEVARSAESA